MESYFNGIWKDTSMDGYKHSGYSLVDYVNNQKPSSVLDIGCGYNRFKNKIDNLIGIDPYNDCADIKVSIEDYNTAPFEIVMCLGSINFGDEKTIDKQIEKIHTMFRKEAIFRVNPGIPHDWADYGDIVWYPWTLDKIHSIAAKYDYWIKKLHAEYTEQGHMRYFFVYSRYETAL
tara:strand:- start:1334 stop:1858 length:525 start_codon:yes stop_codon:yes gene_type:complete